MVSVYSSATNSVPFEKPRDWQAVFYAVQTGVYADLVQQCRLAKDKKELERFKKNLNGFTPSGIFTKREITALISYSGVVSLDFDKQPLTDELRERLRNDNYVMGFFVSPSGTGFKVFVKVSSGPQQHGYACTQVAEWFQLEYEVTADTQCFDITRLCFFSADAAAYYNPQSFVFEVEENYQPIATVPTSFEGRAKHYTSNSIEEWVQFCEGQGIDVTETYKDWIRLGFALIRTESAEKAKEHFHRLSQLNSGYDEKECDRKFKQLQADPRGGKQVKAATLIFIAKKTGFHLRLEGAKPEETKTPDKQKDENKAVKRNLKVKEILKQNFVFQRDMVKHSTYLSTTPESTYYLRFDRRELKDADLCGMMDYLNEFHQLEISKQRLNDIIGSPNVSEQINPLADILESFRADFQEYSKNKTVWGIADSLGLIDAVIDCIGDLDFFNKTLFRKWIVATIAQVLKPDHRHKNENILIFYSAEQGIGKTRFFNHLFEPFEKYVFTGGFDFGNKDFQAEMTRNIVIFNDELSNMTKTDMDTLKGKMSQRTLTYRVPYAQVSESFTKIASFAACTNRKDILTDETGNRRFWVIELGKGIKMPSTEAVRLLWGAAIDLFQSYDLKYWLDSEEIQTLSEQNKQFEELDATESTLQKCFDLTTQERTEKSEFFTSDKLIEIITTKSPYLHTNDRTAHKIGRALRKNGFVSKPERVGGQVLRGYWLIRRFFDAAAVEPVTDVTDVTDVTVPY